MYTEDPPDLGLLEFPRGRIHILSGTAQAGVCVKETGVGAGNQAAEQAHN